MYEKELHNAKDACNQLWKDLLLEKSEVVPKDIAILQSALADLVDSGFITNEEIESEVMTLHATTIKEAS